METIAGAATAEISRSPVWQAVHNRVVLSDTGEPVTDDLVELLLSEESDRLAWQVSADDFERYCRPATGLIRDLCPSQTFTDFLTLPACELIT